jgi:hypothetical protein
LLFRPFGRLMKDKIVVGERYKARSDLQPGLKRSGGPGRD